ncbi:A disintegrin and metalloproteinase with thrombospondin motifs 9-like [Saccostrea echinata]|uniref:A disintegrin and metalloproteinase with thrombospondin motifs 9-like n=1 Tax=Saccostrea echinata TaxID=191078 RepID=UPI002A8021BA|nr:A disintegrin and metalloproteinase with thrombospondin motifs 9-like [Saccostrea echinata]
MHKLDLLVVFYVILGIIIVLKASEISLRQVRTRLDLIEPSLAIWSGSNYPLTWCGLQCLQNSNCVSLLYNSTDKSCKLFQVIYSVEEGEEDIVKYFILDRGNSRSIPESCKDVTTCSGTTTDGEYWIYPQATNRKRVKIYCNNMAFNPTEYITLKNPNSFIDHDQSNWPIMWQQCQSSYIPPLKRVDFQKVGIQIQNMEVNGMDYSFALLTGTPTISYGRIRDCNGESFRSPCPHFASATINTKGTGLVIDPSLTWGVIDGSYPEMRNFQKSTDDSEISFTCSGWCSTCGPKPGPVVFQVSNEFISAADAQALICHN